MRLYCPPPTLSPLPYLIDFEIDKYGGSVYDTHWEIEMPGKGGSGRRVHDEERGGAKRRRSDEECTQSEHTGRSRRQCWGIPNNTCFAFIRLIRSASRSCEGNQRSDETDEVGQGKRIQNRAPGESLGNPHKSEDDGESLGNPKHRQLPKKTRRSAKDDSVRKEPRQHRRTATPGTGPKGRSEMPEITTTDDFTLGLASVRVPLGLGVRT